ncbi:MAG: dihydroorotate dehydrogenase-like protein [Pyrinomonadaceae bacterium]|nr:dihydroorotate dehydrogenase-like protein [Pyrinomonadaceae bacterium]MBP6213417.1 dihydroorotate dehydrogenase-like protein [Pyrinomonadaceae bacterium]
MPDLSTTYMGLKLRSPLVVSANPLSQKIDNIAAMEDAGAGAVVLFSLFEEQIRREAAKVDKVVQSTTNAFAEAADFFPDLDEYAVGTGQYLDIIRGAKDRVDIPIIASLNGTTPEGWIEYAREIEQAGADGLEINVYFIPADILLTSEDVERRYVEIVALVRDTINIPIAVKLNPYFSSIGNMSQRLSDAGADALVFFNRFYQPDFDIEELKVLPNLDLSIPAEIRLPLLWIANLYGKVPVSFAATTGVHGARELIKYILAGADIGMVASVLLKNGIPHLRTILNELDLYMRDMPFESVEAFRGSMSLQYVSDPTGYERSNYIQILGNNRWSREGRYR